MSKGKIKLTDAYGNITEIKSYNGTKSRQKIINKWRSIYKNTFFIVISIDEKKEKEDD